MILSPDTATSLKVTVGSSSVAFGASMERGELYLFSASTPCWIAQGASPTASAGAGSMYVPGGAVVVIAGFAGGDLAVIQDSAGGKASLCRALTW